MRFQWDSGNTQHIIDHYPERANSTEEVESLFDDPAFSIIPDRIDKFGEQQYHGVGLSNKNRVLYVVFSIRNGEIRPISCRPTSRKERKKYAQITQQIDSQSSGSQNDPKNTGD